MKKRTKYLITIDDEFSEGKDCGIDQIAFTKTPAILTKGFAFNSQLKNLSFADNLKYRIAAPAMIPMEIYRNDDDEEYYVEFTADEIEKIHSKFMANLTNKNMFNLEHDSDVKVPAYVLEAILVDSQSKQLMIKQEYNIDVPIGTSFIVTQITDKDYYNQLVENEQIGYSIEGFLGLKLSELINNKKQKLKEMNKEQMMPEGEYTDKDGNVFYVDADGNVTSKTEMALEPDATAKAEPNPTATASGTTKSDSTEAPDKEKMSEEVKDEEVKKEELADALPAEAPVEEVADVDVDSYSKTEVDAKLDEIYKIIADMQLAEKEEESTEEVVPVAMSLHDKFAAFVAFSSKAERQ